MSFGTALAVLLGTVLVSFVIGRFPIDPVTAVQIVVDKVIPIARTWDPMAAQVVWAVRWPRILMAVLVGASLSVSGTVYQGVFRNPLVSPDILGVAAAASFGAAVGITLQDANSPIVSILAFGFGIGGVAAAYLLAKTRGAVPTVTLILAGVVVSSIFTAGVSIMKYLADPYNQLPAITFWLMGSLTGMRWQNLLLAAPLIVAAFLVLMAFSWRLNLLTMGDDEARSLGVPTQQVQLVAVVCATVMTATAVSQCGTIGWIGLVIPHLARLVVGPDHRKLIPAAAVLGGTFLLAIDDLTRSASEASLPLSIPIALIGAPFFALLLRRTSRDWTR